ncbi:hypothetical protein [Roseimicrobium gellanilyticum]|nr:hypothetical protein [Roseimicrobium gellanilyticum]
MKPFLLLASVAALLACTMVSCVHPGTPKTQHACGFSDPEMMATMGICMLAGEYYIAHGQWPATREHLEVQTQSVLELAQGDVTDDEAVEIASFLDRFDLVELHKKGKNLVIHYRITIDKKTVENTLMLRPKATVDEIIHSSIEGL